MQEMRDRVRDALNQRQKTVDPTTGEGSNIIIGSFANDVVDDKLNTAIIAALTEIAQDREEVMSKTVYIGIPVSPVGGPGVVQFAFPFDMLQLRWLKWLPPGLTLIKARPSDWRLMPYYEEDDVEEFDQLMGGDAPSWRREGNTFILNRWQSDPLGTYIQCTYVFFPPRLVMDTTNAGLGPTLDPTIPLPTLMQEFIILEAAATLADENLRQVPDIVVTQRQAKHDQLMAVVQNMYKPVNQQMYSNRMVRMTYSGRACGPVVGSTW